MTLISLIFVYILHFNEPLHFEIIFSVFFGLSFVLVLLLSIYFISNVYVRWSRTPIIVTLSAKSTSITDIPFPTVTICNLNRGFIKIFHNFFFILNSENKINTKNVSESYLFFPQLAKVFFIICQMDPLTTI